MRPAVLLVAFAALAAARPLDGTTELETSASELDAMIEEAHQQWVTEQDEINGFFSKLKNIAGKVLGVAAKVGKVALKVALPRDVSSDGINPGVAVEKSLKELD
ncbi:hypothetical protein ONZ45_g19519 [Pleurotus djamor]|nr:hypothetical protein ONZ45_g19519 [Pleurotus djamor]